MVVGADAPNPITGSDEGLWYHAWFEDDGKPSPVTEMTLRMVDELCDAGRGLCEPIDQLLQGGP